MTPEQVVNVEIKRFCTAVNCSPTQNLQLTQFLNDKYNELLNFMHRNSGISRDDLLQRLDIILSEGRSRVAEHLSPEQLTTWDNEIEKAKQLLGDELAD